MFFCSYNTRGLNNKISFYKDFIASRRLGLIALLETHVKKENSVFVSKQVAPNFCWLFNYECHYNGRIWVGWDPGHWNVSLLSCSAQQISCSVKHLDSGSSFFTSFVYAYNDYIDRRILWAELLDFKTTMLESDSSPWALLGDLNVCMNSNEISNTSAMSIDMREFCDFVELIDVFDLNFTGKWYTWWDCNHTNPIFRKLDGVLVGTGWVDAFPLSTAQFLPRGLSDHSPALLHLGLHSERIFKPFQVFQHILEHRDFIKAVESAWADDVTGDPWFILTTKLKKVKLALKTLNNSCGNLHEAVISARRSLDVFQENLNGIPSADMCQLEEKLCNNLHNALIAEEKFLKQKSRVNWLKLGDGNNAFFHRSCKSRWNVNKIVMMEDSSGNVCTSHKDIADIAINYFSGILGTHKTVEYLDDRIEFPQLTEHQQRFLCAPFSAEEVFKTFKRMAKKKSPRPDGWSPEFFLAAWSIIGEDVIKGILHFFSSLELPRIVNSVAIALVPKCANPTRIEQFRPISCCNTLYKCIAKLLSGRIKKVISSLISFNQAAFVPGRIIGDNVMLVQAICRDYHRNDGNPRCAFKLDIHKAFDSLSWDFLFAVLERMNFPSSIIEWIRKCITGCMVSIKLNGALEGFFQCKNGLRQGDPLSPYLFVLCMEVLTRCLNYNTSNSESFSYHWRTKELRLSHLTFVDDLFLFCKGDLNSATVLLDSVLWFSKLSGLILSASKCLGFFCSVPEATILHILNRYGFSRGELPINYLGLPLITSRLNKQICAPLLLRLSRRIQGWAVRTLRYSGRLQLIISMLQGIHNYWSMYLFLPNGVLNNIQSIFAKFLWGGSLENSCHYKVAWVDCCYKKDEGGLGVKDLFEWNKAAVLLQVWRLTAPNPTSVWILWIHSCLLKRKAFWTTKIPYKCPWNLRKIFNARQEALTFLSWKVFANSGFKFWHDPWLTNMPLIEKFGTGLLSVMDSTLFATVGSFIHNHQWTVVLSNDFRVTQLRQMLANFPIGTEDMVLWQGDSKVSLGGIWNSIRRRGTPKDWLPLLWHKFHIPACSFITWLACRDRLLTKDRMIRFHMATDPVCLLCHSYNESAEHLFSVCPYTYLLLRACPFKLHINWTSWQQGVFFQEDITTFQKCIAYLYITVVIYLVWLERNGRTHGKVPTLVGNLSVQVKRMVREKLFSCAAFQKRLQQDPTITHILY